MDLDKALVSAALQEGRDAVRQAIERGVSDAILQGEGKIAYQFVLEYLKTYGDVPSVDAVESKTQMKLETVQEPSSYFVTEVLNRRLHKELEKQIDAVVTHFQAHHPQDAYAAFEEGLRELRKLQLAASRTISLPSLGPDLIEYYEKVKAGYRGVLTPWPTVNETTLGFWPEDFVLFVARLGVGKTWALVILAECAWAAGKRVLFATTEMAQIKIVQRWAAVRYKLPYKDLRMGTLSVFAEQKLKEGIEKVKASEGLYIIGGDFDFRIESLEAAIEECEPDVVFMDGAYLLKVVGEGRVEKAANSFDELKRVAKRHQIPLVASTQFNREVKGNKLSSAGAEKIALSDAAGWNADLIYGLVRTEDMKKDRRMILKPLKFREGEGEDIECWWDFDLMNFDELPKGPQAAAAAGGGGAGGSGSGKGKDSDDVYGTGVLPFGDGDDDKKDVPF